MYKKIFGILIIVVWSYKSKSFPIAEPFHNSFDFFRHDDDDDDIRIAEYCMPVFVVLLVQVYLIFFENNNVTKYDECRTTY
jgi:hypothetical protein